MKTFSIIILIAIFIHVFGRNAKIGKFKSSDYSQLAYDTSIISILPYDTTLWQVSGGKQGELLNEDFRIIDSLFISGINSNNLKREESLKKRGITDTIFKSQVIIDLKRYKYYRQYISIINKQGEKIVFINCFCGGWNEQLELNWRKRLIQVEDGGSCYFHLFINLTTKVINQFSVNDLG